MPLQDLDSGLAQKLEFYHSTFSQEVLLQNFVIFESRLILYLTQSPIKNILKKTLRRFVPNTLKS